MSWAKIRNIIILKCRLFLFYTTAMKHFSIRFWHVQKVDFTQQPVTTSSVVTRRRSSQALPKAKLAPKKCHGHCLVVCGQIHPPQLSESWLNHYIWEVCSANGWDAPKTTPAASTGQQKGPSSLWQLLTARHKTKASKAEHFKSWMNRLRSVALSAIFTWLLANWLPLLQASWQLFAVKMLY